jgi:hypothetical protein
MDVPVDGGPPAQIGAFAATGPFGLAGDATHHVDVSVTVQ